MQTTNEHGSKAVNAALARVDCLPLPVSVVDKPSYEIENYDDFQYVDCPYDDYQDK